MPIPRWRMSGRRPAGPVATALAALTRRMRSGRPWLGRLLLLVLLAGGAIAYALLILAGRAGDQAIQRSFGAPLDQSAAGVYADLIAIDPLRQSIRVRFDFTPGGVTRWAA